MSQARHYLLRRSLPILFHRYVADASAARDIFFCRYASDGARFRMRQR